LNVEGVPVGVEEWELVRIESEGVEYFMYKGRIHRLLLAQCHEPVEVVLVECKLTHDRPLRAVLSASVRVAHLFSHVGLPVQLLRARHQHQDHVEVELNVGQLVRKLHVLIACVSLRDSERYFLDFKVVTQKSCEVNDHQVDRTCILSIRHEVGQPLMRVHPVHLVEHPQWCEHAVRVLLYGQKLALVCGLRYF